MALSSSRSLLRGVVRGGWGLNGAGQIIEKNDKNLPAVLDVPIQR